MKRLERVNAKVSALSTSDEGNALLDSLIQNARVFIFSYSSKLKSLVAWSPNALEILGVRDVAILRDANLFLRHVHDKDRFTLMSKLEEALRGEGDFFVRYRWIRPDNNEVRHLHCRASPHLEGDDLLLEGVIIDITNYEGSVKENELLSPTAFALSLPFSLVAVDRDLRVIFTTKKFDNDRFLFGDPDFRFDEVKPGRPFLSAFSRKERRSLFQSHLVSIFENNGSNAAPIFDEETAISVQFSPLITVNGVEGCLMMLLEVSKSVRAESEVHRANRESGFRSLASGILHNINNSLQSLMGEASLIIDHSEEPKYVQAAGKKILETSQRIAGLGRELLAFDQRTIKKVDLNLAAVSALNRVPEISSSGTTLEVAFGTLRPVVGNPESIVEIIEGILKRYKKIAPQCGQLAVKTFEVTLGDREIKTLRAGIYAKLVVSSSQIQPIKSTNAPDAPPPIRIPERLSPLLEQMIEELDGGIQYDFDSPFGVSILVYLPIETEAKETESSVPKETPKKGSPTVLIVDDDPLVLETVSAILLQAGFECAPAHDLQSALRAVTQHRNTLRVVLIDAIMPGDEGAVILRKLKGAHSGLVFIGFSGAAPQYTQRLLDEGAIQIIRKPADPKTLTQIIKEVLLRRSAA